MSVHPRHSGWSYVTVLSWRAAAQRFSFAFFLITALFILVLGRTNPVLLQSARGHVLDGLTPLLDTLARPLDFAEHFSKRVSSYMALQAENEKLRNQNAQLVQWQNAVVALEHENKEFRNLLHFKAEPNLAYISARVIADTGGPFVRSLVVTAGSKDGVREGMAAMTGEGLVGRIVEVNDRSSRILMLTDLNSRLPVIIAGSGEQAIVAGDNTAQLKLLYLPQDSVAQDGQRVMTSGHGGIFPPNLPVGVVSSNGHGSYSVQPLASVGHITYVTLIDFNLAGGTSNSIANKINNENVTR